MKLNYKRTICVGFAFFLICAFWQAYDNIISLTLTNKFGMPQAYSGIIMAMDNILALFMLPLFGAISDKCKSRLGKRTPFILVGTVLAAVAFLGLSFVDHMQLTNIAEVKEIDSESSLEVLYEYDYGDGELKTPDGVVFRMTDFEKDEFLSIRTDTVWEKDGEEIYPYTEYVFPARQLYAWQATLRSPATLLFFIGLLFILLLSMAVFRSPAVALMPDVTVKPLRSKANAVINLMGSAGAVIILVLGMVFGTGSAKNALMSYVVFFGLVSALMIASLIFFLLTVKENRFVKEMEEDSLRLGLTEESEENATTRKLTGGELLSLLLLLASVMLWYMGYNAVTSKYSVYASNILQKDYNMTLIIAQAAAIISYLPIGMISSKLGRKKCILAGVLILGFAFGSACFITANSSALLMNVMFALAGIGWATINVNSFPMVVELAKGGNVGRYTGYYYTASMAAQVLTPYLSGLLMDTSGMRILFPYATAFVALAFLTMLFVRHGDAKPLPPASGLEAIGGDD